MNTRTNEKKKHTQNFWDCEVQETLREMWETNWTQNSAYHSTLCRKRQMNKHSSQSVFSVEKLVYWSTVSFLLYVCSVFVCIEQWNTHIASTYTYPSILHIHTRIMLSHAHRLSFLMVACTTQYYTNRVYLYKPLFCETQSFELLCTYHMSPKKNKKKKKSLRENALNFKNHYLAGIYFRFRFKRQHEFSHRKWLKSNSYHSYISQKKKWT